MKPLLKENLYTIIAALLAICMVTSPFVIHPQLTDSGPTWLGLDDSGRMALNYAMLKKWVWGKDVIYTYGPLAFFSTRIGLGISRYTFLLFDVFIVLNFFAVFRDYLKNAVDKYTAIIILLGITFMINPYYGSELSFLLLFFTFHWLYKSYNNSRFSYYFIIAFLITLSFYIKLNTGLTGVLFLFFHLTNLIISHKINVGKAIIAFMLPLLFISLLSVILHVSLPSYIKSALELLKGYNDIMFLNQDNWLLEHNLHILFFFILAILSLNGLLQLNTRQHNKILYTCFSIAYIFLLKKQATLRNDEQHLWAFYYWGPLILVNGNFLFQKYRKLFLTLTLVTILFSLFFITGSQSIDKIVASRLSSPSKYLSDFNTYPHQSYFTQAQKRHIPQHILTNIGNSTVDIFPWDINFLLENKLNYAPRPNIQSHMVITDYLIKANYNSYVEKAPLFIIYDYDAIDNRYPFNEEALTNMFIAQNYRFIDSFTSNGRWRMVLQKKKQTDSVKLVIQKEEKINIADEIPVNSSPFLKINVQYNLLGEIKSFWNKPSQIDIMYQDFAGRWLTYKTSSELLKSGIYTGKLVLNTQDVMQLVTNKDALMPVNRIKLVLDKKYFSPSLTIQYFSSTAKPDSSAANNAICYLHFDPKLSAYIDGKYTTAIWSGDTITTFINASKGSYKLSVESKGTPVGAIYPHLNIWIDTTKIGEYHVSKDYTITSFYFKKAGDNTATIKIWMDNDAISTNKQEDRNAFIYKACITKSATP